MSSLLLACNLAIHNINSKTKSYYKTKTILSAAKARGRKKPHSAVEALKKRKHAISTRTLL